MQIASSEAAKVVAQRYPTGLYLLCGVIGAERFSFYLLSTFLVLYLNERLGLSADRAVALYGYLLCGSYVAPLLGGKLADGRLGSRLTALVGSALLCIGYLCLFVEHITAVYCALLFIAVGGGLFRTGMLSLLGKLFAPRDARRTDGFSLFFSAINVAALAAPLVGSLAQQRAGWLSVFILASCGMLNCLSSLALGRLYLPEVDIHLSDEASQPPSGAFRRVRLRLALVLLAGLVFGIGYVQSHSSLLLWIRDHTDRRLGSLEIPVAWFAAAPAALVLFISPFLSRAFVQLRRWRREPSTMQKLLLGLALASLAFVPLWAVSLGKVGSHRNSPVWVLCCLAMLATAELLVPALGPSEVTRVAPPNRSGRWLGYWFVALAAGHLLGGWIHF